MKLLLPHPYPELHPLARLRVWLHIALALAHGLVSFGFNLLVLALTLNLVASAI